MCIATCCTIVTWTQHMLSLGLQLTTNKLKDSGVVLARFSAIYCMDLRIMAF